jgi:hypothetical protein
MLIRATHIVGSKGLADSPCLDRRPGADIEDLGAAQLLDHLASFSERPCSGLNSNGNRVSQAHR